MNDMEQPKVPIWMEAKSRKQIDVMSEVTRFLAEAERVRVNLEIPEMTERDLEAEQFRLEDLLHRCTLTVADFRRLREIDWYLDAMRERREYGYTQEEWKPESLNE